MPASMRRWRRGSDGEGRMSIAATASVRRTPSRTEGVLLLGGVALAMLVSFVVARDHMTWAMETVWVMLALPWLAIDRRLAPTRLLAWLLALHALVLIEGGAYTYAQAPIGEWLHDLLHTQRNPWDRVGHFMQGFV